ncbi:MAG: replication initiation negative regulator SeqA [Tissierellia bacterium]|jgi:negative regulator of replication initiation|nr:replication initiation negative regulator SeqA [Tissierellia bacterium]
MDKLIDLIRKEYPSDALEIQECIDLLSQCISGCTTNIKRTIDIAFENKDYSKMKELPEYLETIEKIQKELDNYVDALQIDEEIEKEIEQKIEKETLRDDNEIDAKELPTYSELSVDSNIPYNLYDDYTYKRPAAFELLGQKHYAKDWKDVFVQTCEILASKNDHLFSTFVADKGMQGRKMKYFCTDKKEIRSPRKIGETGIYVMTNMSANQIRNVIEKMLRKYGIKTVEYKIYLKADYTARHI